MKNHKPQYDQSLVDLAVQMGSDRVQTRIHNQVIRSQFEVDKDWGINGGRPSKDNPIDEWVSPDKE